MRPFKFADYLSEPGTELVHVRAHTRRRPSKSAKKIKAVDEDLTFVITMAELKAEHQAHIVIGRMSGGDYLVRKSKSDNLMIALDR
jgi:hypothetical protein